jgi:isoquinoline 1-oxidoreductase beta subunit
MRLLSAWSDHAGGSASAANAKAHGSADHGRHGGEHLSLWHLSAHSRSHQVSSEFDVMTQIVNVSRRGLLKGIAAASGLVLGCQLGFHRSAQAQVTRSWPFAPNVFVAIDATGLVTIVAHRAEMGTGIKTDLPLIVADELEADWNRVRIVQAQGDARYGDQNTDGSCSTTDA